MEWLTDPQVWVALATLTALEIVLGIDNIIFISILASKLPQSQQSKARMLGLDGRHGDSAPVVIFFVMAHEPDRARYLRF